MKKIKQFIWLIILSLFSFASNGQDFQITNIEDSVFNNVSCTDSVSIILIPNGTLFSSQGGDIDLAVFGTGSPNGSINITVDWGDGSPLNSLGGQMFGEFTPVQTSQPIEHSYDTTGTYYIVVTVVNTFNNTSATRTIQYLVEPCHTTINSYVTANCLGLDPAVLNAIPFIFERNGIVEEIFLSSFIETLTPLLTTGLYSISISPWWLQSNGLAVSSPPVIGANIVQGDMFSFVTSLVCDTIVAQNCISGVTYCDNDGDGMYNPSLDVIIPNALVTINVEGLDFIFSSDVNGNYSFAYEGGSTSSLSYGLISPSWLSANNFFASYDSIAFDNIDCASNGNFVNFPMDCDSSFQIQDDCIAGWVFNDLNTNQILDQNEIGLPNIPVTIVGQNGVSTVAYTNAIGQFFYFGSGLGGQATVSVSTNNLQQCTWNGSLQQTVPTDCNTMQPIYFSVFCPDQNSCTDLYTEVSPWIGYYQNYTNYIKLEWGGNGPSPAQSYTLSLTYPPGVTVQTNTIANSNYVISGNTITWNVTSNSTYFNTYDVIAFNVPGGLNDGTVHNFTSTIVANGNNQDCDSTNNYGYLCQILGSSYDPNDKTVNSPEVIAPDFQDELTYRVRFQNTGTAPAQDVYVLDTLSTNLDWSTFELLDATHYIQVIDLGNGVKKFNFPSIWLPDSLTSGNEASQGSFTYKIKENIGNGVGTSIENTAYIYFDWNPAIITNTTYNLNTILSVEKLKKDITTLHPNPVSDELNIVSSEKVSKVVVYDLTGKIIVNKVGASIQNINTSELRSGVYIVELTAGGRQTSQRIIKR